ncbi:MAG TPA: acyl-CoA dehydrogenase family protein, partial [Dehalococcoidia bacterium]|nr:acyl-CoA dehydrogenase family protein [Dehalococcoidia bacterium]
MDFSDNKEQAAFRQEVRDFIKTEVKSGEQSDDMERGMYRGAFERLRDLRGKLSKRGWIAPAWPKEYGGAGLDVMRQFIMNEEFASNRVPPVGGMGVSMVGPTLIVHGNEEQKKEHLGRILNGEVQWCQGFSEPGSGSDLASLQTRAVRDGDDFVINGQKIWTSGAQYAHWMFMMARTDPDAPKHKGISYFLVDMKSPGITVRPLTNLANQNMFNEVFFEDVRVPARNLVGELNRGWYIGTTTLDFERSSIGSAVGIRLQLDGLVEYAKRHEKDGTSRTAQISSLKTELADRYVEANVARLMSYRVVTMQAKGMVPNHEASMTKLFASELNQRIARTGMKVLGLYGQLFGDDAPMKGRYESSYMTSLSSTIAGGT